MVKALKDLKQIGFDNIQNHEFYIKDYLIKEMKKIDNVIIYGDTEDISDRIGVISFNIKGMNYEEVAMKMANDMGIALRCGKFCAHPYVYRLLGVSDINGYIDVVSDEENLGLIRVSLGLYNTMEEAKTFIEALQYVVLKNK